jgi:hypothetical protein
MQICIVTNQYGDWRIWHLHAPMEMGSFYMGPNTYITLLGIELAMSTKAAKIGPLFRHWIQKGMEWKEWKKLRIMRLQPYDFPHNPYR